MITWVFYFVFILLLIRLSIVVVNFFCFRYLPEKFRLNIFPKVSVLIPARNEVTNIGYLLADLKTFTYPNFEVVVYDDQSTDGTAKIAQLYSKSDKRFGTILICSVSSNASSMW